MITAAVWLPYGDDGTKLGSFVFDGESGVRRFKAQNLDALGPGVLG